MRLITSIFSLLLCCLSALATMSNSIDYSQLYIVGDAVEGGWALDATPMSSIDRGVFTWTGNLKGNQAFKFMNSTDGWHKHIVATTSDDLLKVDEIHHLNFFADWGLADELDNKFKVEETGEYTLIVDLRNMCVKLSRPESGESYPAKYYATGSALDNKVIELDKYENAEFKKSLSCKAGNIILMDTPSRQENTRYFTPLFEDVDLSFGQGHPAKLVVTTDASARGWSVSVPGDYMLYISCNDHKYTGRKHTPRRYLYLVGGCCEKSWNYWDPSNCVFHPNPENADELIWEGELRIGWADNVEPEKFKILTEQSWFEETYHPYISDTPAEGLLPIRTSGGDDTKWVIKKDGKYRFTVNTKDEILFVEFLSAEQMNADNNSNAAIETPLTDTDVTISCANGKIKLVHSPEPVSVSVVNLTGILVAQKPGITEGLIADNLPSGVYLIMVKGATVNKTYKVSNIQY